MHIHPLVAMDHLYDYNGTVGRRGEIVTAILRVAQGDVKLHRRMKDLFDENGEVPPLVANTSASLNGH